MCKREADAIEAEPIPASMVDGHLWASIIQYLEPDDLMNLRLVGSKKVVFHTPLFTSHLPLMMDRVPFFGTEKFSPKNIIRWLSNRQSLVINGRSKNIHPLRVASLVKHDLMNSVTEIAIKDFSCYISTISELAKLPNLKHVTLLDEYYDKAVEETTAVMESLKGSTKLETLDIEFDW